jgi:ABC-type nitrate/sulfonate/bicarbonate transport system substrate-binding protein
MLWTTAKFHDANPKTYAAFLAALTEANEFIAATSAARQSFT